MRVDIDPQAALGPQLRPLGLWKHLPAYPKRVAIVYRWRGPDDRLLYIGTTVNPEIRWAAHRRTAAWWHLVRSVEVEFYDHPGLATNVERVAIQTELPEFNIRSRSGAALEALRNPPRSARAPFPGGKDRKRKGREEPLGHPSVTGGTTRRPPVLCAASAGDGWFGTTR